MATEFTLQKTFKKKNTKHREGRKTVFINKVQGKSQLQSQEERITFMRELVNKGDLRWTPPRLTQKTNSLPMLEKGK